MDNEKENLNVSEERNYAEQLATIIRSDISPEDLKETLDTYHDNDIAESLSLLSRVERNKLYDILDNERISDIFAYVGDMAQVYLEELGSFGAADVIENMDADDAIDLLEELDEDKKQEIIELLETDAREDIDLINSYGEEQIGSRITTNYISFKKSLSVKSAMKSLIEQAAENDNITTVYVTNDDDTYYGAIQLTDLFIARADTPLDDIIITSYPYLFAVEDISDCLETLKDYEEDSIPVLDDGKKLIGVITGSDVVEAVDDEMSEDYVKFAAVTEESDKDEPLGVSLKKRTPWLIVLLALGLVISGITGLFENVIDALPFIVCSQSLVLDMSGNVGTQSLAVTIRVLTDENLSGKKKFLFVLKELRVAFTNAVILSAISLLCTAGYMSIFHTGGNNVWLTSACISLSLVCAMVIAGFIGTVSPIILNKCKVDPAVASGPLITALNDLISVVVYYGLAFILLM